LLITTFFSSDIYNSLLKNRVISIGFQQPNNSYANLEMD
jgi:hypothetical protein